jgi:L-alanine-DL-glutamate epimerase-like enolase superfamily enzyme
MTNTANRAVRIVAIDPFFSVERPSGVFSFGATTAGDLTLAHVRVRIADRSGREATGWGAILLSHGWAFPGTDLSAEEKDQLMRQVIPHIGAHLIEQGTYGHPLDHFLAIEPELANLRLATASGIDTQLPHLASLVAWSPVDAAIHDAYGNLHEVSSYDALDGDYVSWDLGHVLGPRFAGKYLTDYLRGEPATSLAISHTVGAADPLNESAKNGEYPALTEWIADDGAYSFKVKLKGQDLDWDIARLIGVYETAIATIGNRHAPRIFGDLNEQGPSLEYIIALLDGVEAKSPATFAALDALEQPASRHLGDDAVNLSAASARIPIVLDEGLTSLAAIDRAIQLGWNGIAFKTCKTQSLSLLAIAKASELGLHCSVQDLTNPGIALIQSLGLAARLPETAPIESNQRQFFPASSAPEAARYPTVYSVHDGQASSAFLTPGLGYGDLTRIDRAIFHTH